MKYLSIISLLVILLSTSCTKKIDIDLNDEENKRLVVDALFSTYGQAQHEVKLSMSANYYSADAPTNVSGASVVVSDGSNSFTFSDAGNGIYKSSLGAAAIANKDYTLTINYDGKTYTASNYCDSVPNLDTIVLEANYVDGSVTEIEDYTIKFTTQELVGFGDYYAWKIYVNGEHRNNTVSEQLSQSDEFLPDGSYLYELELTSIDDIESGDTVMVAQHAISKDTYDAYFAILFQTDFRGGIFDSPPANVPTNLSEGAVGLFSVSGESRNFTIVP